MAHKTLINGTAYSISGGRTLVGGTAYSISGGRTLVGGTAYSISFVDTVREELRARLIAVQNNANYTTYSSEYLWTSNGSTLSQYTIAQHVDSWLADAVHNNPASYPTSTYQQAVADAEYSLNYYINNGPLYWTWNLYYYNAVLTASNRITRNKDKIYRDGNTLLKYATNSTSDLPAHNTSFTFTDSNERYPGSAGCPIWENMIELTPSFPYIITENGWYCSTNAAAFSILCTIYYLTAGTALSIDSSDSSYLVPSAYGYEYGYYYDYTESYSKGAKLYGGSISAKPWTYPNSGIYDMPAGYYGKYWCEKV